MLDKWGRKYLKQKTIAIKYNKYEFIKWFEISWWLIYWLDDSQVSTLRLRQS